MKNLVYLTVFISLFCLVPQAAFALETESNTVTTNVGNPPDSLRGGPIPIEKLAQIFYWGQIINDALLQGLPQTSFNKMVNNITNGSYTASIRQALDRGVGQTGIYWCTNLIIDAFNLAGITGLGPNHQGVRGMLDFWKTTPGYVFIANTGTDSLKTIKPGFAVFRINPGDYTFDHVSMVKNISIDDRGNGSIETIDSNSFKGWISTVVNGKIIDTTFLAPIVGFGGIQ